MSIASEISRLQSAKADLKTAIEGKGVTVPSATTLDGYADLVDSISGGGGGGTTSQEDAFKSVLEDAGFVFVTFTPQTPASGNYFEVQHTLGKMPTDAIWFAKEFANEDTPSCYLLGYTFNNNFGADNVNNRTAQCFPSSTPTIADYVGLLKSCGVAFIPWLKQTNYNASSGATAQTVSIRNQANNTAAKMATGEWYLGVR